MGMEVHYKHISPWLLTLFAQQPELVPPFTCALDCRTPTVPVQVTRRKNLIAGKAVHLRNEGQEEFDIVGEIRKDMREQITKVSPKNARRILDELKSGGFSLYKYFYQVQFHIAGEVADHGTTLLSRAVTGDEDIGEHQWPYGPATVLSLEDVEKVAATLSQISDNEFLTKYSTDDWDKQSTKYALFYFKKFVAYYAEAAKAGHAMLVWAA